MVSETKGYIRYRNNSNHAVTVLVDCVEELLAVHIHGFDDTFTGLVNFFYFYIKLSWKWCYNFEHERLYFVKIEPKQSEVFTNKYWKKKKNYDSVKILHWEQKKVKKKIRHAPNTKYEEKSDKDWESAWEHVDVICCPVCVLNLISCCVILSGKTGLDSSSRPGYVETLCVHSLFSQQIKGPVD